MANTSILSSRSPYASSSFFTGNITYIDLESLKNFIKTDLSILEEPNNRFIIYEKMKQKEEVLKLPANNFLYVSSKEERLKFKKFKD